MTLSSTLSYQLIHMLPHFVNRCDHVIHALAIAQQYALIDPDRLALRGALGNREVLRAEIKALGEELRDRVIFGRWPKQRVVVHHLVAGRYGDALGFQRTADLVVGQPTELGRIDR